MKAMILEAAGAQFVLKNVPDPAAGAGEAVAQVIACGSGLTIQHVKVGRMPATFPRIIGHEITAEVVEVEKLWPLNAVPTRSTVAPLWTVALAS